MPRVNPDILIWGRETAGLTREEAAKKVQISAERLAALETGSAEPTRPQLVGMASAYRRPLVTFYMAAPPKRADLGEDFRTLPGVKPLQIDARLDALLRDVRTKQTLVRSVLEDDEDVRPLPFIASVSIKDGAAKVVGLIQKALGIGAADLRTQRTADKVFSALRDRAEALGIFVLLLGDLGSHHTALDVETFRGFALADPLAPFVVINDKDARTAWSFTLVHELAHLWIGATGVSGGSASGSPAEKFCNDVATLFLLPTSELQGISDGQPITDPIEALHLIAEFADQRHLSQNLVAYRAYRAGFITRAMWMSINDALTERLKVLRDEQRTREKKESGAPDFYTVRRHRLGPALVTFAKRALDEGLLTPTKAAKLLGVKPRMVTTLVNAA